MLHETRSRTAFILAGLLAAGSAGAAHGHPGPLLRADDPPARGDRSPAARTPLGKQFEALMAAHEEDLRRWSRAVDAARTQAERDAIPKVDDEARGREALALAEAAPGDPAALEVCCRIAIRLAFTDAAGLAMARIRESHLADPRLGEYLPGLALSIAPEAEGFLRAVRADHEDATVRDRAALALARNLLDHALSGHARHRKEGGNLINDYLGPDEEARLVEEVEGICEMVRDRRADDPWVDESEDEPAPTTMGKQAAAILEALEEVDVRRLAVGRPAPEIVAADEIGGSFRLGEARGKAVLLSFGGQHCVPCRAMIPHERELQARLAKRPFALVGFDRSDSDKAEDLKAFLRRENVTWPVFQGWAGDIDVFRRWNVHAIPVFYLIDDLGVIRHRFDGYTEPEVLGDAVEALVREAEGRKGRP